MIWHSSVQNVIDDKSGAELKKEGQWEVTKGSRDTNYAYVHRSLWMGLRYVTHMKIDRI